MKGHLHMDLPSEILCPVCNKSFGQNSIQKHVEDCLKPKRDTPITRRKTNAASPLVKNVFFQKMAVKNNEGGEVFNSKKRKANTDSNLDDKTVSSSSSNEFKLFNDSVNNKKIKLPTEYEKEISNHNELKAWTKQDHCTVNQTHSVKKESTSNQNSNISNTEVKPKTVDETISLGKVPLADQMRPTSFDFYYGQNVVGTQNLLKELFLNNKIPSMILWGPPGCGKTTLAHIISKRCKSSGNRFRFVALSATMAGVHDVKEAVKVAKNEQRLTKRKTVLFIDEVHRFNKLQQDTFLPHIEDGTIILIGATTENPSFHLNNALLSRCHMVVLNALETKFIVKILQDVVQRLQGVEAVKPGNIPDEKPSFTIETGALSLLAEYANGDARCALNKLDMLLQAKLRSHNPFITCENVKHDLQRGYVNYDRNGDDHFDIISALQKSIRGSDVNASVYWLARMLEGGEQPLYIARRLVRTASEDIGLADPNALHQAVAAYQACHFIGMPECDVILAQAVVYLAKAPKSVSVYESYKRAKAVIKSCTEAQPRVPLHLRNAPNTFMEKLGYGAGYKYLPTCEVDAIQTYLPDSLQGARFYDGP